ncbi:MAG: two-component system LytT family response regulator [Saprospiraceae bacterium]|jgi:two-component system LytT family response regulator|tara:strand:+ start:1043 stop:1219 length:177 start_codon:yes stop_codon:yes gene_type:complete
MTDIEKELPNSFMRIHRWFMVNLGILTAYSSNDIEIGKKEIPIVISYNSMEQGRLGCR